MRAAIVGTGISGVTLALRLQQLGVETTLFGERSPDDLRQARVENFVARFPATRERERLLGADHWSEVGESLERCIEVSVAGAPIHFRGWLPEPAQAVDFREYLSRLVEDYAARGGAVRIGALPGSADELSDRTAGHDVVVVAVGRAAPVAAELFPRRRDRSPYARPQRRLVGGLCTGITPTDPPLVSINLVPGVGEIVSQPFLTAAGVVAAFLVEAVPGGPLETITHLDPARDPAAVDLTLAGLFERYAPALAARLDRGRLCLLGPKHWLAGAITPTVRGAWAALPDGRLALAIGDAWVVNDPILGQGANIGSHCAWVAAQALAAGPSLDEQFGRRLEDEMWAFAGPVTALNNAFLQPPPPHVVELLAAAAEHQAVADAFVAGFAEPVELARTLTNPAASAALAAAYRPAAA